MTKIKVDFQGGESRNGFNKNGVNYMIAEVDGIELYAEVEAREEYEIYKYGEFFDLDWEAFDEYSYPILKASIIEQAIAAGIDPERLVF